MVGLERARDRVQGAWEWLEPLPFDRFVGSLPQQLDWPLRLVRSRLR